MPVRSSSSAAKPGHIAADSRLSRSSSSSPKSASVTGASIPAATDEAPAPGRSRSTTATSSPAHAARHAVARPGTPAPTTTTSCALSVLTLSLRRHYPDQVLAVGHDFALGRRRCRPAVGRRGPRPLCPERGPQQRDDQADDAHHEQDRADRLELYARHGQRDRPAQNRAYRNQKYGCPYPHSCP